MQSASLFLSAHKSERRLFFLRVSSRPFSRHSKAHPLRRPVSTQWSSECPVYIERQSDLNSCLGERRNLVAAAFRIHDGEQGYSQAALHCVVENVRARRFYERVV